MEKETIRKSFEAASLEFREEPMDDNYKNPLVGILARGRVSRVIKESGRLKGKRLLEIGCEAGYVSITAATFGAEVYAFDVCLPALKRFSQKLKKKAILDFPIHIFSGMAQNMPLKDNSFDRIICTEVLEHVPFVEKTLAEMSRVLKPGGIAVITFPNEPLRKKLYPLARLAGINVTVEDQVTLFSYEFKSIVKTIGRHIPVVKAYSWPNILPVTRFVICKKKER